MSSTDQAIEHTPNNGFLKTDFAFPIGNAKQKYLWINCDICSHRVNWYKYVNGLWLCQKCSTIIENEEKRIIAELKQEENQNEY